MTWNDLADKSLKGGSISQGEALGALNAPDEEVLSILDAAYRIRRKHFGKRVKLNFLLNAKSGLCPEDCSYCSQSKVSKAEINKYPFLPEADILAAASRAVASKARRMVKSSRFRARSARCGRIIQALKSASAWGCWRPTRPRP